MPFQSPNFTQVPNDLFDHMPYMNFAELMVTLIVIRETIGWQRDEIKLSIQEISKLTGLTRKSVWAGAKAAEERGLIECTHNGRKKSIWRARVSSLLGKSSLASLVSQSKRTKEASSSLLKKLHTPLSPLVKDLKKGKESAPPSFVEELETELHINLNGDCDYVIASLARYNPKDGDGSKFSRWWVSQHDFGKRGQPPSPKQIIQFWPQAFKPKSVGLRNIRRD